MRWAYGVTTVLRRRADLLPRTLASLASAGFDRPRLFLDGANHTEAAGVEKEFGLEVTARNPAVRTAGSWVLALHELYLRNPSAERYAVFQDDFVACKGLRAYLERTTLEPNAYWNCFTMPSNESLAPGKVGWFRARELASPPGYQTGRGAVALVFSREGVNVLLSSPYLTERAQDEGRGWRSVDGGIVTAMNRAGWSEFVHMPSLVQHVGAQSVMGNKPHKQAATFRGETWDALTLLG